MKILVTSTTFLLPENVQAKEKLEAFAEKVIYNDLERPLEEAELIVRLKDVDGMIAGLDDLNGRVIAQCSQNLKVISRYGVGVDRVDIPSCRKKGIAVTNTPAANSTAVCEMAFALMLAVARNVPNLHNAVEKGNWPRANGVELSGKTLGIVGLGAIGKKLAVRARAFEMKVLAYDLHYDKAFVDNNDIEIVDLETIFQNSDIISLHVPLNEGTRNIVNKVRLLSMKKGSILINTSRGGLIDEAALAQAIKDGHILGAGLDTFEEEPLKDSPLRGLERVILTPHAAGHTAQAISSMGMMSVDNLIEVLKGGDCKFRVD